MAVTTTARGIDIPKSKSIAGELYALQIPAYVSGTYLTATKPNFNVLTALQQSHSGVTAVKVKSAVIFRDGNGSTRYSAPNANISLSTVNAGCTNDKITFRLDGTDSTDRNGTGTGEVADATDVTGTYTFLVLCEITTAN